MPTRLISSSRSLWLCALLLASGAATGADKPAPPKPSPEAIRAKAIADFTPTFKEYLFSEESFPSRGMIHKKSFYDRSYRLVRSADAPGPYGVVVEATPKSGRSFLRFVTLYRTAAKIDGKQVLDPHAPELAKFQRAGHGYAREGGPNRQRTIDLMNCFVDRQLKAAANRWFA